MPFGRRHGLPMHLGAVNPADFSPGAESLTPLLQAEERSRVRYCFSPPFLIATVMLAERSSGRSHATISGES
jgi:hypothetical protein